MSGRHGILPRRSRTEWVVRGLLLVAVAWLGSGAVRHSLAWAIRTQAPERAHRLAPDDGPVTALLAEKLSGPEAGVVQRREGDRLARLALRQDATAVGAVATLGLNAQIGDNTVAANRLFVYSERLSRRDLRTQLRAIEDAVGSGRIGMALHHYDIALRTSRFAPDLLFPVLATAIQDHAIRVHLAATMSGKPAWAGTFVDYVGANGSDPRATADLFRLLPRVGVQVPAAASTPVINALIAIRRFNEAWDYYASLRRGVDRRNSRDPSFIVDPAVSSPFDWQPTQDAAISSSIQRGGEAGVFSFSVPSTVGGTLLQQLQLLPPGRYVLEGRSANIDLAADERPYWVLKCLDDRELGRITLPNSAQEGGQFTGRLSVPEECPVQHLTLIARPSEALAGVSGQITRAWLRPER